MRINELAARRFVDLALIFEVCECKLTFGRSRWHHRWWTTAWLEENLEDPSLRIVDLRGGVLPATEPPPHYVTDRAAYEEAHIPGAVFVDWQADIVEPGSPSYDIASPARFAELMGGLGIDSDTYVVVYEQRRRFVRGADALVPALLRSPGRVDFGRRLA